MQFQFHCIGGLMRVSSWFGEGAAAKFTAVGDFSGVDLPG